MLCRHSWALNAQCNIIIYMVSFHEYMLGQLLTIASQPFRCLLHLSKSTMGLHARTGLWPLYAFVTRALTQQTYGDNYLEAVKDSDTVASAFPDVEGVNLLAPAFTNPQSVPAGFANGTSGPTDLYELGMCCLDGYSLYTHRSRIGQRMTDAPCSSRIDWPRGSPRCGPPDNLLHSDASRCRIMSS